MRVDKQVTSKVFPSVHRIGSVPAALMGFVVGVVWILSTGSWNDAALWDDTQNWQDS